MAGNQKQQFPADNRLSDKKLTRHTQNTFNAADRIQQRSAAARFIDHLRKRPIEATHPCSSFVYCVFRSKQDTIISALQGPPVCSYAAGLKTRR
ncbi:MAG: hypothetical protein WBW79_19535, partial [Desulfocapsaceae bacterium]